VVTCHGILGNWGEHPSRICAEVGFEVRFDGGGAERAAEEIRDAIDLALAEYVGRYGDKSRILDPATGRPKVDRHYEMSPAAHGYHIRVLGASGHMGAVAENDCAITKAAAIVRALVRRRQAVCAAAGGTMQMVLHGWEDPHHLVMEGGQGFLPTHTLDDVQRGLRKAALRGVDRYLRSVASRTAANEVLRVTFDKLHNEAFAGRPDSPDMRNAIEAAKAAGIWRDEPIRGWESSCDARIFACEYPNRTVLTTGPGRLAAAHSDREYIDIDEMVKSAAFLACYMLKQTGPIE
jgi:acetylornithine deacetylase/succinyl-diaminopimelate desuccinylase-like protein